MSKAVLFDIDGTILDTDEFIREAFKHALRTHAPDAPFPEEEFASRRGEPIEDMYAALAPGLDARTLIDTHRDFQKKNLHLSEAFVGAADVLKALRAHGIKLAAVTTRSKITSLDTLRRADLMELFDAIVSGEDTEQRKPDPAPLLKALEMLQKPAMDAYMVGDSPVDVEAGKRAGTKTIGVTYGFHGDGIEASNPDYVVRDIKDILPILLRDQS